MITDQIVHQCRLQTIRDVIRYAMTKFKTHNIFCGHGCSTPYEEAYFLVLRSLKLEFEDLSESNAVLLIKSQLLIF